MIPDPGEEFSRRKTAKRSAPFGADRFFRGVPLLSSRASEIIRIIEHIVDRGHMLLFHSRIADIKQFVNGGILVLAVVILPQSVHRVAARTNDSKNRPLSTYNYIDIRPIHILDTVTL